MEDFPFDIPIIGQTTKTRRTDGAPETAPLRFTLTDMSSEWTFFNHGALFAYAGFQDPQEDPLNDWFNSKQPQPLYLKQAFERPIFEGLDTPAYNGPRSRPTTWNHMICGVETEYWEEVRHFLAGVVSHDQRKKELYQTFYGELEVLDPGYVERYGLLHLNLPKIKVTVFCIDAGHARWEFRLPENPIGCPYVMELPPRPSVVEIARAFFAGDHTPLANKLDPEHDPFLRQYMETLRKGPIIKDEVRKLLDGHKD